MDSLVTTKSCYVGLYDLESPVNRAGFWRREWVKSKRFRLFDLFRSKWSKFPLFRFNQQLLDIMNAKEMISWTLLFDGVFRAQINIADEGDSSQASKREQSSLAEVEIQTHLICRSGRLVLACLSMVGEPTITPTVVVERGIYDVRLVRNYDAESKHWFTESEAAYLPAITPDWTITLQRISNVSDKEGFRHSGSKM